MCARLSPWCPEPAWAWVAVAVLRAVRGRRLRLHPHTHSTRACAHGHTRAHTDTTTHATCTCTHVRAHGHTSTHVRTCACAHTCVRTLPRGPACYVLPHFNTTTKPFTHTLERSRTQRHTCSHPRTFTPNSTGAATRPLSSCPRPRRVAGRPAARTFPEVGPGRERPPASPGAARWVLPLAA